ncbi:MAG: tetratricopeptide repeat protein [Spirochaetales bacterium]|nr:tetratricopeptide repeat protein [Spirochaetales bacterium]
MPKPLRYQSNSIVYFKGDASDYIYILKSGSVILRYNDIETGQELQDIIAKGEFFGVNSALGKFPREDTAFVAKDAEMIQFTVPEFEVLVMKNTRIIMKMLKVFSNQLRRIHKQVSNLMSEKYEQGPEEGLYKIGTYYHKCGKYVQAVYAYRRYLTYYPSGKFAQIATASLVKVEKYAQSTNSQTYAAPSAVPIQHESSATSNPGTDTSKGSKEYYDGMNLFTQGKYEEALKVFKSAISSGGSSEFALKAYFEIGRCLFSMKKYEFCVKHFSGMINKYPKHPDMLEALLFIGKSYKMSEQPEKAKSFLNKVISMASEDTAVYEKASKELALLKG